MMAKTDTKKARVYIASPFFTPEQVERVKRVEEALEANPFVEEFFSPRLNQVDTLVFGSELWREAVFNQDISFVKWATVIVSVADMTTAEHVTAISGDRIIEKVADTDSGTAFELGYAFATDTPILVLHETDSTLNLMLSDSLHYYTKDVADIEDYNFIKMPKSKYTGEVI